MTTPTDLTPTAPDTRVWSKLLPELTSLAVLLVLAAGVAPSWAESSLHSAPTVLIAVEGAMLLLMWTLIDVASRLRKSPPWWLGLLIISALLLLHPDALTLLTWAWSQGHAIFLPVAWSVIERLRELWTLPRASRLEKFRRRALSNARVFTALYLAGLFVAGMLVNGLIAGRFDVRAETMQAAIAWLLIVFYAVAAFDAWRVHRPAFELAPRMLWRHSDDDTTYLAPF